MPAATNRTDLLTVFDKELSKLNKTLADVDEATANACAPDDTVTVKGVIAHRTHWMGMFHTWFEDGLAGREVHVPAKGYKWNQLKAYNAALYSEGDRRDWADVKADFDADCNRLRAFIDDHQEVDLYAPGAHSWTGKWTLGRYAEASGPSHFRSANAYVRKALKGAR